MVLKLISDFLYTKLFYFIFSLDFGLKCDQDIHATHALRLVYTKEDKYNDKYPHHNCINTEEQYLRNNFQSDFFFPADDIKNTDSQPESTLFLAQAFKVANDITAACAYNKQGYCVLV